MASSAGIGLIECGYASANFRKTLAPNAVRESVSMKQGSTSATDESKLLISAAELGKLLGVNKSTVWSWHSSGRIPLPVKLGGTTRWKAEEIRRWVEASCPPRARWEQVRRREGRP